MIEWTVAIAAMAFVAWIICEVWKAPNDPNDAWHKEAVDFREKSNDKVQD